MPYNKNWLLLFEREKNRLLKEVGNFVVGIEHIGSTSIPDISAKPIIDISLGVKTITDTKKLVKPLKKLGYELRLESGSRNVQTLFVKGPESKRTYYLHVMKYNGAVWKDDILFRDYLRRHKSRAK